MSLEKLMYGQNVALIRFIMGKTEQSKFVDKSLDLVQKYVEIHRQAYGGVGYINEVVSDVRLYKYDGGVEWLLQKHNMVEEDKERHKTLAKWYSEFFIKYYVLTQAEDMQPYLGGLRKIIYDFDILNLFGIVSVFNEFIRIKGIRNPEQYMLDAPAKDILVYCQEGPQKYRRQQTVSCRQ